MGGQSSAATWAPHHTDRGNASWGCRSDVIPTPFSALAEQLNVHFFTPRLCQSCHWRLMVYFLARRRKKQWWIGFLFGTLPVAQIALWRLCHSTGCKHPTSTPLIILQESGDLVLCSPYLVQRRHDVKKVMRHDLPAILYTLCR